MIVRGKETEEKNLGRAGKPRLNIRPAKNGLEIQPSGRSLVFPLIGGKCWIVSTAGHVSPTCHTWVAKPQT